ncbi:MAG: hypothetical protein V3T77_09990, partial [Planctomycetota bacterium]
MTTTFIALLALPAEKPPPLDTLAECLTGFFGDSATLQMDAAEEALSVSVADQQLQVASKAAAIPWSVLEGPVDAAWYWPQARAELRGHRCHLAVVLRESATPPVVASLLLTRSVALLGERLSYLGVLWDAAPIVHSAASFSESARAMDPQALPLRLWVDFQILSNEDGSTSLFTRGLEALGGQEIEVRGARRPPDEV